MKSKTEKREGLLKIGQTISFYIDVWPNGKHQSKQITTTVEGHIIDPIGIREPKYLVIIEGQKLGIPMSNILPELPFPKNSKHVTK